MKYRTNDVYIVCDEFKLYKEAGNCGQFVIKEFFITSGQDPKGNIKENEIFYVDESGKMQFVIGREGSKDTANWWKKHVKKECNTFYENPVELNFAFLGTLTLNIDSAVYGRHRVVYDNICIAQGNNGRNNWWFGGESACYYHHMYHDDRDSSRKNSVMCFGEYTDDNGKKYVIRTIVDRSEIGDSVNTYTFYLKSVESLQNANWLSSISDDTRIKNIMMPGSHDAGMSELHHTNLIAGFNMGAIRTQKNSIYEQLLCGCRYFDIRVDYDHEELVSYHRPDEFPKKMLGANGQSISDIFLQASDFLQKYNSEFVIFKISHFRDFDDHEPSYTARKMIDYAAKSIYVFKGESKESEYQLHEIKKCELAGKILLIYADEKCMGESYYDCTKGVFKYHDVETEVPETIPANQMNVFDKFANKSVYEDMKNDQLEKWEKNAGYYNTKLFLLSWTMTLQGIESATGSIEILAKEANGELESELKKARNDTVVQYKMPNIVYIDFVDSALCNAIIKQSFENWKK